MTTIKLSKTNWFVLQTKSNAVDMTLEEMQEIITEQLRSCDTLLNDIRSGHSNRRKIKNITFDVDDSKFSSMIELNEAEDRHPIITFHGTSKAATKSILQGGYKAAGINGGKVAHGQMYGPGVYSSHFLSKANSYAGGTNTLIINVVFLGKIKLIPSFGSVSSTLPKNGVYNDGSNTRVVFGLDQIICADPARVIPIGTVTLQ